MADLLNIGSSALLAYRSALNVVGQNVANANTAGYSRQRVDLQSRTIAGASLASGSGVSVRTVQRLSDKLVFNRQIGSDSAQARSGTFAAKTSAVDTWLSGTDSGLSGPLNSFFYAVNALGNDASSSSARQVLVQSAASLASRFNDLQARFDEASADVDAQTVDAAGQINALGKQIAALNGRIAEASAANPQQPPNELIDSRDQALRQLAQQVGITTTTADDGSVNVNLGSGQALVLGTRASSLSVGADAYGRRRELTLDGGGAPVSVTQQISGGALGGLADFRREVLEPAERELGALAASFAGAVNAQQARGMDQYGQLGSPLFGAASGTVLAARSNLGTASATVGVADSTRLTGSDYTLGFDGAGWRMTDATTGADVALTGSGSASDPLTGAGVSLVLAGTARAGDRFLVQPTTGAAGAIALATLDPARIAAASPLRTSAGAANSGLASITSPQVLDANDAQLTSTVTIQFTSANTYSLNGSGSYAYANGGDIEVNGWRVQVSGAPVSGDRFTLSRNDGSSGDNTNLLALSAIADQNLLGGGRSTLTAANAALVSTVGSQAQQASAALDAQNSIATQVQSERDSVSGVNLDEEAADLMRYQQAYQAAAQVVSAANQLFDSLLSAVRG